jgi:hypothetical protein
LAGIKEEQKNESIILHIYSEEESRLPDDYKGIELFSENMGTHPGMDEISLSDGKLYTIVTNKVARGRKGCLVALISGTKA